MRRLLLFETMAQLEKLLRRYSASNLENAWVALSPEADYAAERIGLTYRPIEDFYDDSALIALGIGNYKVVGDFCDALDQMLRIYLCDVPEIKYFSAHQQFHTWKVLFDAILNRVFAAGAVLEGVKPEEVVAFGSMYKEWVDGLGFRIASVFSSVLPVVAERYGVRLTQLAASRVERGALFPKERVGWLLLHQLPGGRHVLDVLAWLSRAGSRSAGDLHLDKGYPTLVVVRHGYEVDYVVERWRANGIGPVVVKIMSELEVLRIQARQARMLRRKLAELWGAREFQQRLAPYFNVLGMDCYPVASPRLRYFIFHVLPHSLAWAQSVSHVLQRVNTGVVLSIFEPVPCQVARQHGIPAVIYQHGGVCGYLDSPILEHSELYFGDYFFCYGEGVVRFLNKPVPSAHRSPSKHRAEPVAVGSAALDSIVSIKTGSASGHTRSQATATRRVVYVSSGLMGDARFHTYLLSPEIAYWRLQREVIQVFGRFPGIRFVAKLYPHDVVKNPVDDWFRTNPLPNVEIVRDVPFREFLGEADLFIVDQPTTTLLQALATRKKVIVYADRVLYRFVPGALDLLKKRAVLCETREQFLRELERVLDEADWTLPEPVNDEFLRAYGTYLNDGRSAERAVRALVELAGKSAR